MVNVVSIPPKSGLSFSLSDGKARRCLTEFLFLSRLNPVSVFHEFRNLPSQRSKGVFLSRLNPVSVFHVCGKL